MKNLIFIFLILSSILSCKVQQEKDVLTSFDPSSSKTVGDDPLPTVTPPEAKISCRLEDLGLDPLLGSPSTIKEAIDLINVLPKPTSLPCFIESLKKPVKIYLTSSSLSVQPAIGPNSPRIFILHSWLTMSIATSGDPSYLLEFAQYYTSRSSFKGEIRFPVLTQLPYSAPYDRVDRGDGSACRGCHLEEVQEMVDGENAYRSMAVKPESINDLNIITFSHQLMACDLINDATRRCQIIRALYDQSTPTQATFPTGTPTFYESLTPP